MNQTQYIARKLGQRLRAARRERGMTLQALGTAAGLSAAFLSRVERGEAATSIANLIEISSCLGVPLRDLFEDSNQAYVPKQYTLSRRADRPATAAISAGDYEFYRLTDDLPDPHMAGFLLEFPEGGTEDVPLLSHEGEEMLYLLEGRMEFQIGGDRFTLEPGDCVHFKCEAPHMGRNIGTGPARMLMLVSPSHLADHPSV